MSTNIETPSETQELVTRFNKHVAAVQSNALTTRALIYSIYCAKGIHKLLAELAVEHDDEEAGNVALGAPHWVTYNAGTLEAMLSHTRDEACQK